MCSQLYNLRVNRLNVLCYFIIQSDLWLNNITNTAMTSTVHGLMFGSVTFITGGMLASNFARGWGGGGGSGVKSFTRAYIQIFWYVMWLTGPIPTCLSTLHATIIILQKNIHKV